ncbi:MAG: N-acetylmuramic acid 6-phosphate etherase, partial [Tepidisphaeraceae bacterium]
MEDRSQLLTEQRLPESMALDAMSTLEAIELMNRADAAAVSAVAAERRAVARAIELVTDSLRRGGRLVYFGAGTSGRLGVLDAAECPPTFRSDPRQIRAVIAGGDGAMFKAVEGAEDSEAGGEKAVDDLELAANDVAMGIAAGGTTPFVRGVLRKARQRGAATIFLCCVQPVEGEPPADVVIRPLTGPEVLTGSTRLKAGTATKLVLNQITTLSMVRLGKVHENLMVDLRATNEKLWDRGARIVAILTGLDRAQSLELLKKADGQVKVAGVMGMRDLGAADAAELLRK